jgi:hypothetical protein
MRAKFQCIRRNVFAPPDGDHAKAHPARVLQRHVPEATNAENGDRVAGFGT